MPSLIESEAIRGLDATTDVESLSPEILSVATNGRFTSDGRAETRLGYRKLCALGTGVQVDNMHTHSRLNVMFAKSGTKVYQSTDWEDHQYDIGLTRTATEQDAMETIEKNVFITNQTDAFTRVAVSKVAAIDSGAGTFSVTTGDGENFTAATVYIRGTAVTAGSLSGDDFSSMTGLTASMAIGDIVTQTSEPSGAPKGSALTELEGSTIVSNKSSKPTAVHYSAARTDDNPEFAYDFTANGAGSNIATTDAIALGKINGGIIIGMKSGIAFSGGFDILSDELPIQDIHSEHGVHNFKAFAQGQKRTYVQTNTDRILPITNDQNGVRIIDPDDVTKAMDYPIRSFLEKSDTDQTFSYSYYDPKRSEAVFNRSIDGLYHEFVFNETLGTWSVDIGKTFMTKIYLNGKTYAGSDNSDEIYEENFGRTDDTIPIEAFLTTGVLTKKPKKSTFEFTQLLFNGLFTPFGEFTMRIKVRDAEVTETFTAADMISKGYMSTGQSIFIGSAGVGNEAIGGSGSLTEVHRFTIPFDFLLEGESIQLQFDITDEGVAFALGGYAINPPEEDVLLFPST